MGIFCGASTGLSSVCHTAIFMTFILLLHMTIVPGASFPFPPSGADAGDGGADGGGGAGKETKIDCHTYCERYLEQAEYTDGAGSRVEHCDALHRLLQCVRTMDVTAQDDNPLDPQHSQCLLHFGSFSVMTWVMKSLSDKCRGVPPPDDTKCNVSAACPLVVGKRRSLPAVCQTRHLQVCQVFGDRHLVRGNGEVLETCSMPGRWPLLHVRHVGVYASNTPHRLGGQLPRFDPDVTVATQLQSVSALSSVYICRYQCVVYVHRYQCAVYIYRYQCAVYIYRCHCTVYIQALVLFQRYWYAKQFNNTDKTTTYTDMRTERQLARLHANNK